MRKLIGFSLTVVFLVFALAAPATADSIWGSCVHKDGSKCGGSVKISTSWDSKNGYPSNGQYTLDFGGTVDKRITVYCNGSSVGTVYVKGRH